MGNILHLRIKRSKADFQQCKDCQGNGSVPNPARPPRLMDCATCYGQGTIWHRAPYRLANSEWSDGVDRAKRIALQISENCDKQRVFVWRYYDKYRFKHLWVVDRQEPWVDQEFDEWEDAVAYADRIAREATAEATTRLQKPL